MDELFEKIKKLIAEKLEVDERKITMGTLFQDLGADSLDTYELVYTAEEKMGITIPDEKANKFKTVKDAYEYIKSQVTSNDTTGATSTSRVNDIKGREEERSNVNVMGNSTFSDIYEAVEKGNVNDVKYFIEEKRVNVNSIGGYKNETPLHTAAWFGKVKIAEYLISKGADVNAKNGDGGTPLFVAAIDTGHREHDRGKIEVAKFLISEGADVNAKGPHDLRPLDMAYAGREVNLETMYDRTLRKRMELQHYLESVGGKKGKSSGGGCYIATCVYGSYDCPEVCTLRRYRDSELSSSWFGRRFIRFYYVVSPKIVKLLGDKMWFNRLCKPVLDNIVRALQNNRGL